MSAEKTASVKITLNSGSFLSGLKAIGRAAQDTGQTFLSGLKAPTIAGLKAMGKAAGETMSSVKNTLRMVGGLGGALSLAESVKGAIDLRSQFKGIAYDIKGGTGELVDWRLLMRDAQEQGVKWGIATEDLGRAFARVNQEVADVDVANAAMKAVAVTARGTGKDVETLADVAGKLNEKFGVASAQMEDGLAKVVGMSLKGGIHFEDMASAVDRVGSSAKLMGIQGIDGFQRVIGIANLAKGSAKNLRGALGGVMQIMDEMGTAEGAKKMMGAFQISTKDAKGAQRDLFSIFESILKKTHGKKSLLARGFQGEQLKIVNDLGEVYRTTFEKTSGTVEQKTAAALAAYRQHLDAASTSQLDAAKVAENAAERMSSPSAQMAVAMEQLKKVFTSPDMMNGMIKLAKIAPAAAQKLAGLAEMALNSPGTALAVVAGLKLGVPFLQGAIAAGAKSLTSAMLEAAPGVAKMLLSGGATGAFTPTGGAAGAGGKAAGLLGNLGLLAGAGAAGFAIGDLIADKVANPMVNASRGKADTLQAATLAADMNTSGKFTREGGAASLEALRASIEATKKDREFSWKDVASGGLRRLGTAGGGDVEKAEKLYEERKKAIDGMAPAVEKVADASEKAADSQLKFADAVSRATRRLDGFGLGGAPGGAPTEGPPGRGPIRLPPTTPGYVAR